MKATATACAPPTTFEIRIAVLGYVSAGKTTVINALLRDKYGQVGMKRTTAGVNCFRLHPPHRPPPPVAGGKEDLPQGNKSRRTRGDCDGIGGAHQGAGDAGRSDADRGGSTGDDEDEEEGGSAGIDDDDGDHGDVERNSAARTLEEISEDNAKLREGSFVSVKTFDIAVSEQLCEVRPDTRLVLVDIPGINEAGADGKYRAAPTPRSRSRLLEFVRDNNRDKKDIPTIIVCNKVDDPEDQEQAELVKEAKEEVDKIFAAAHDPISGRTFLAPVFVPTSAEFAYIYRTAALLSFERFRQFDEERIDRLGRKEVGWKFSKLPLEEKLRLAYEAVTERELFDDRIKATNFHALLRAIAELVGGSDTQLKLIQKQMDVALDSLCHEERFLEKIQDVFEKRRSLGLPTDDLPPRFWAAYEKSENAAFDAFAESPAEIRRLAKPVTDLADFYTFSTARTLGGECAKCLHRFKALLLRQIQTIFSKEETSNGEWTCRQAVQSVQWGTLNPVDWVRVCQSVLLLSNSGVFREQFGLETMRLDNAKHKWMGAASRFGDCPKCKFSPLDFNGFCQSCNVLVFTSEFLLLKRLLHDQVRDWEELEKCCFCSSAAGRGKGSGRGRGRGAGRGGGACKCLKKKHSSGSRPLLGFELREGANANPLAMLCSTQGCSQQLNANRLCERCMVIYCLRGSSRSRYCMLCRSELEDGICTWHGCCGTRLTWRELPFASMLEAAETEWCLSGDDEGGVDGLVVRPRYPETYRSTVHLDVPASPSDPDHMGHVAWRYCKFVEQALGAESQTCVHGGERNSSGAIASAPRREEGGAALEAT